MSFNAKIALLIAESFGSAIIPRLIASCLNSSYENFPQEFFSIVAILANDCNYNLNALYIHLNKLYISGCFKEKRNDFMLRFGNNQLIVARVEFIHQRNGYMTNLYKILQSIRKKYKLDPIIMEQCITEGSKGWVTKNGFIPYYGQSYIEPR